MAESSRSIIASILSRFESQILEEWLQEFTQEAGAHQRISEREQRDQCAEFLRLLQQAAQTGFSGLNGPQWDAVRDFLAGISASRAQQGFSMADTAIFVFSFKRPLFNRLRAEISEPGKLAEATWQSTELIDRLGLYTSEAYIKSHESVIIRQQQEMLELSTPVVKLWDGILALPLIGTLDSNRTQVVMESLLQRIVETNSEFAIIDITGVPTVDTLVAQHLMKTVSAARLMGVECIISGVRPQIAQTIVHLGVALGDIVTKATLADAFRLALKRSGASVPSARGPAQPGGRHG